MTENVVDPQVLVPSVMEAVTDMLLAAFSQTLFVKVLLLSALFVWYDCVTLDEVAPDAPNAMLSAVFVPSGEA